MKKLVWLCLPVALACSVAFAQEMVLQGGVTKVQVDNARVEAFNNLPTRMDLRGYPRIDPDLVLHLQAKMRGENCLPDREITFFSNGEYSVSRFGDYFSFYFKQNGELDKIEAQNQPTLTNPFQNIYPIRRAAYQYPNGKLIMTGLNTEPYESYHFYPNGSLQTFCKDNYCYPVSGVPTYREFAVTCDRTDVQIR